MFPQLYSKNIMFGDIAINLQLWDTAGQESYRKLRPLSYSQADVFVIIFSLVNLITLQDVLNIWVPEIKEHCPGTPYLLVGTKKEIRDNFQEHRDEYLSKGYEPIQTSIGIETKEKIQAEEYFECETYDYESISQVFNSAIKIVFKYQQIQEEENLQKNKNKIRFKKRKRKQKEENEMINNLDTNKSDNNDEKILKIGFFGDEKSGKKEIVYKYLFDDFISPETNVDNENFYKIIEVNNTLRKLKFEINFPYDLRQVDGLIFIFNANDENSLNSLQGMLDVHSINDSTFISMPHILVANYGNVEIIRKKDVRQLIEKLNCEYFEINSNLDDIDIAFYYLLKMISKLKIKNEREERKKSRKKKKQ